MEGYRTIIVALVGGPLTAYLSKHGLDMTPEVQAWFVGAVMTLLMVAMRLVTKTPVGGSVAPVAPSAPATKQGGYARPALLCMIAVAAFPIMASLPACSALAPAKSFDEQLAYSYGVHTAVLSAAASSVTAKEISGADGQQVLKLADQSRQILDAARIAELGGDPKTAEGQLQLATTILTELQSYLRSHGK